ncbi:MAG: endonuclease domain-containing protein [Acidaminococcaceae bacterium]|nr:endonuclease domain-containing protein [Acidaminococcaceae bacterium]
MIIELDGSGHYMPEQEQYDKRRTILLQQEGYMVLRFSNYDIDKNFYGVCSEIDKIVKERMRSQV